MSTATLTALLAAAAALLAAAPAPAAAAALPRITIEPARGIDDKGVPARVRTPGYAGPAEIEVRGQFSRTLPKKSYALELRDEKGENADAPLLGMPADDDWVLYAAYNDRTLMRDAVAYDVSRSIGRYAARTRFVELRMRGRSRGVYVLMEKLKLQRSRVAGGDDAFLLELTSPNQAPEKGEGFLTPVKNVPIAWEDPDREDLDAARAAAIRASVDRAERAIYGPPGAWRRHLHGPSAVDHLLLNELFKNQDGMFASTFLTAPRPSAPLRLGPIWDFDISMGARGRVPGARASSGWMLAGRPWAEALYRDRAFARAFAGRWRELRREGLRARVLRIVDRHERALRGAAVRLDLRRWPAGRPHRPQGGYGSHVRFLEGWLNRRIAWIDRNVGGLGR